MQSTIYAKAQRTGSPPSPQDHKLKGKFPNSYQNVAFIVKVYRKLCIITLPQQKTNKSEHLPLQSPHTRVCGRRRVYDKTNKKTKLETNPITYKLIHIKDLTKTHTIESKLASPHPSIKKHHKNNTILGRVTIKNQMTNILTSMKHKLMYTNLYKDVTKTINQTHRHIPKHPPPPL